ncbi:50S ribosomal protein L11 methyltransferase, partial [Myxococcota bacterium]|nr:50S ribosomal protein L11 methyltransferase [Myxococcota bacterium]
MCAQTYGYFDIGEHAWMLLDRIRVDAFERAIKAVVRPGDVVADIGTGTGVLAAMAAKAGARRVYAVDRAPILEVARALFAENHVDNIIEVIRDDARKVEFPEPPNVVVSEMVGNFGIEEDMLGMFNTIAAKCTPDVRFIPSGLTLFFVPLAEVGLKEELERLSNFSSDLTMHSFVARMANRPVHHRITASEILGRDRAPQFIPTVGGGTTIDELRCTMEMTRSGTVNAIGTYYHLLLAEDITLTTGPDGPPTHWTNIKFPVYPPLELKAGDTIEMTLYPKFLPGAGVWSWEIQAGSEKRSGDSMATLMGNSLDFLGGLRLKRSSPELKKNPFHLTRLAAALGGDIRDLKAMAARLKGALPTEFADEKDA